MTTPQTAPPPVRLVPALITLVLGLALYFTPAPEGLAPEAWHLFAIFVATILGIVIKPLPMGAVAIVAFTISLVTNTVPYKAAFAGFSSDVVWLVVCAFFIAIGFIKTGLGDRIAYLFVAALGKKTLGLGYGLIMTDLALAPAIPSVTARSGGIIYPVAEALAKTFKSEPHSESSRRLGAYLMVTIFQGTVITSAMFLTAMAANPVIAGFAGKQGITLSWSLWAKAAVVPGFVSLAIIPYLLYRIFPPELKTTPDARSFAMDQLKKLGKMSSHEWIMGVTFATLLILWIRGDEWHMPAALTGFIGLSILLCTGVLNWKDLLAKESVWETFVWFSVLMMLAGQLNTLGFSPWLADSLVYYIGDYSPWMAFSVLCLVYFYTHYFFASSTAHVGSMYGPFLAIAIAIGIPPVLAALILAFFSSLFGGLTHYSLSPAPLLFGAGYVSVKKWWELGFICSVVNIIIWCSVGSLWWKFLGLY
ncbi:MAG: anion permease [Waddliaceae bacterium]|nr:anion permease [Waddliaceae bacterium]